LNSNPLVVQPIASLYTKVSYGTPLQDSTLEFFIRKKTYGKYSEVQLVMHRRGSFNSHVQHSKTYQKMAAHGFSLSQKETLGEKCAD
jgi:hypothetical protein